MKDERKLYGSTICSKNIFLLLLFFSLTYPAGFVSSVNQHHLLVCYLHDVKDILQVYELSTGKLVMDLPLDVGTVCGVSCKKKHSDFFYKFSSFTTPGGYLVSSRFI